MFLQSFFKKIAVGILVAIFSFSTAFAVDFPAYENFVTDTTGTLDSATIENLNSKLKNYEAETGTEIAVVLVATTDGMPIWRYATDLGNEWRVGKSGVDNGAILVVAVDDRELFIAAGSQMEGALTDLKTSKIIDYLITPQFKNGDFDAGISAGVEGMIAAIAGESFTDERMGDAEADSEFDAGFFFIILFVVLPWLAAVLGRSKSIWPGGVIGGIGGAFVGIAFEWSLLFFILGIVGFAALGLGFDWLVSRNYSAAKSAGKNPSWWAGGGGFGGGSSGGGGFGGFGGGGFSGGGSGGSW